MATCTTCGTGYPFTPYMPETTPPGYTKPLYYGPTGGYETPTPTVPTMMPTQMMMPQTMPPGVGYYPPTMNMPLWSRYAGYGGSFETTPSWPNQFFGGMPTMMMPEMYYPSYYFEPGTEMRRFTTEREPWRMHPQQQQMGRTRHYSTSMTQLPSRPSSSLEYYTFQNPVRLDANGNRWLNLVFDLPSYKPEEINVTLYTKATPAPYIEIHGGHDIKDTKEHAIKRSYDRKYYFPSDLNIGDVSKLELRSFLNNEGQLCVEALLPPLSPEEVQKSRLHYPTWAAPVKVEKREM